MKVDRFRAPAIVLAVVGAVGSLGLTLYVGRQNRSILLIMLFAVWVLSPFVALIAAVISNRWRSSSGVYGATVVITLASLAVYACVAFGPRIPKPAFPFLITPLVSWALIGIAARR